MLTALYPRHCVCTRREYARIPQGESRAHAQRRLTSKHLRHKAATKAKNELLQASWSTQTAKPGTPTNSERMSTLTCNPATLEYIQTHHLSKEYIKKKLHRERPQLVQVCEHLDVAVTDTLQLFHAKSFKFFKAAATTAEFVEDTSGYPEVCFMGRSNVGKSSLINALMNTSVVGTSPRPGFTQTINWYKFLNMMMLVDLPGYGFAYASENRKLEWNELFKEYLATRKGLKRVFLLIDARVGFKAADISMLDHLDSCNRTYQIVLTKTDTLHADELAKRHQQIKEELRHRKSNVDQIELLSSKYQRGIDALRSQLVGLCDQDTVKQNLATLKAGKFSKLRDRTDPIHLKRQLAAEMPVLEHAPLLSTRLYHSKKRAKPIIKPVEPPPVELPSAPQPALIEHPK